MAVFGIPYQGSKGKYAAKLYRAINNRHNPRNPKVLYDPFCGGLAVSHYFALAGWQVMPSDLDSYTVALLNAALTGRLGELPSEWISRERFEQARDNPETMSKVEAGFIRQVWSFGNSGTRYMYGKQLEEAKQLTHLLAVEGEVSKRLATLSGVSTEVQEVIVSLPSVVARWRGWKRVVLDGMSSTFLEQPHSIATNKHLERAHRVESLKRLQKDSAARRAATLPTTLLKEMPARKVEVRDYREVLTGISIDSTLYLDPPYAGTAEYVGAGSFDHREFWELAGRKAREGVAVYVSEYSAPEEWRPILSFTRPNVMSASAEAKSKGRHREHLFTFRG